MPSQKRKGKAPSSRYIANCALAPPPPPALIPTTPGSSQATASSSVSEIAVFGGIDPALENLPHSAQHTQASVEDGREEVNDDDDLVNQQDSQQKPKKDAALWAEAQEIVLLNILRQAIDEGQSSQNGFKEVVYQRVRVELLTEHRLDYTTNQIRNKVDHFKRKWRAWKDLSEQSGFGYDKLTGLFTADSRVWQAYLRVSIIASLWELY
jgi:hypothetical protein